MAAQSRTISLDVPLTLYQQLQEAAQVSEASVETVVMELLRERFTENAPDDSIEVPEEEWLIDERLPHLPAEGYTIQLNITEVVEGKPSFSNDEEIDLLYDEWLPDMPLRTETVQVTIKIDGQVESTFRSDEILDEYDEIC